MNWAVEVYWVICCTLLFYYLFVFSRLLFFKPKQYAPEHLPPVSVVICAKNEAENLLHYLKVVLIQHYPKFEVIVVNDQSDDNTGKVVEDYITRNPNLRLINIKKDIEKPLSGKKFPLKVGIEAASYDIIVTTDADCKPQNPQWLKHLVMEFMSDTNFVLGFSPFTRASGFLNKLIRYDNTLSAMEYLSFVLAGMPYKGVGRNMAFRKNTYASWEGYPKKTNKILAGDDLFINAIAKRSNTEIALNKESFIYTQPKTTWGEWLTQKTRHAKAFLHYKFHHQILLFLLSLTTLLFYLFPIAFFFQPEQVLFAAIAGTIVYATRLITHIIVSKKLNNEDLSYFIIFLDLAHILIMPILFFKIITTKEDKWK